MGARTPHASECQCERAGGSLVAVAGCPLHDAREVEARPPIPTGRLLCGGQYPDGTLCKVPAEIEHQHVVAADLHAALAEGDRPSWSVESRLMLVLHRPMLARDIAQTLPHELGARLCDRLETLVQQAKDEATVELSNAVQAEASATMTRLAEEARTKLEAVRDERFGGHSRLS